MATLAHTNIDGVRVLRLAGILNQDGVDIIRSEFTAEIDDAAPLVIDLSGVDIIHTPGIGILLGAHRERQKVGARLFITGASGGVAEVLHTCRLDRVFTMIPVPADAIEQARQA